jgi:hypothetical protein
MIYPNTCLTDWLMSFPDLKVCEVTCPSCGGVLYMEVPVIDEDLVGLTTRECRKCNDTGREMTFVPPEGLGEQDTPKELH